MPGWSAIDIPMLTILPVLLLLSGFFSGSETAFFALTETERMTLRRRGTIASRAAEALLLNQRMLLITILVGNMTVNVLFFVITSVLLMKAEVGVVAGMALAAAFLVLLILLGEVTPKLLANSHRSGFACLVAPGLLTVHRLIGPLRIPLEKLVVAPLSRLTSPVERPPRLDEQELAALLDISGRRGDIDEQEQRILQEVISLRQLKVRDVMTPRVRIAAAPIDASHEDVTALAEQTRLTKLPVYGGDLDHIVGLLHVKRYLLDERDEHTQLEDLITPAQFVPEVATLDQLLSHFRDTRTQLAIVVDEFGGTAGIVALEDVVEEIVGDITGPEEQVALEPRIIGLNRWRVGADMAVRDWAEAFGQRLVSPQVATLGGLIVARLGRAPVAGDVVEIGNVRLEVEQVDRSRVVSVIVTLSGVHSGTDGERLP